MIRRNLPTLVLLLVFAVLPAVIIGPFQRGGGVAEPLDTILLAAGFPAALGGVFFIGMAMFLGHRRVGQAVPLGDTDLMLTYVVVGFGFLALYFSLALVRIFGVAGLIYPGAVVAYTLFALPTSGRRKVSRASVVVKNTPAAAFGLVAEPRNWPRYAPDIELVESVDAPLRVGSRVHYRLRGNVRPLAVDETVIAYEPGQRFGTLVAPSITAVYELNAVPGGTDVAFTQSEVLTIGYALFTAAAFRRAHPDRMPEVIQARMEAIKRLLEEQASVNV